MFRKLVFSATILVLLATITTSGAVFSAYARVSQPSESPRDLPDSYAGDTTINAVFNDSRDNSTPTSWYIWAHQTPQQVTNTINSGYRLVDIDVETFSPSHLFTAVYVANSDSYQKSWWWYYGVDETTLNNALSNNNARLISLKAYDIGSGQIRFTAIMISNTGSDATAWWWYYNATPTDITNLVNTNQARLTQIHAYQTGGQTRYAVVMVDNTGDNNRGWWWYYNVTPSDVNNAIQTNNARLVDMDINPTSGNLNVIMNSCGSGCPYWWWYYGIAEDQLLDVVNQNGARIIDVNRYPGCGSTCYDFVLINNSNAITTRVGEMLRNGTDGTKGLYLEQLGVGVLANLMNYYQFEPASTLKVAPHLYTLQQVQNNPAVSLSTTIPQYQPPPPDNSCPGNTVIGSETIETADREMMWHSDNTTTRELVDYFGETNINTMMTSLGMSDSSINHVFGCGGPTPNETTLDDLALLYKSVINGTSLDPTHKQIFYDQMAGTAQFESEGYDWTGLVSTDIPAIIDQEAPIGMPTALKDSFEEGINLAYKAGNYKICTSGGCATYVDHVSIFGYAHIPFCDTNGPRDYVFGVFIYNSTSDDDSSATFEATKAELLREQIHDGLATCFHQVYLPHIKH
jgi:hypothetical protein